MQVKGAVVQVDRADRGDVVIGDKDFAMVEARCILVDLHAAFDQLAVIGTGDLVDHLLVGNTRSDDADIDAALGT